MSVQGPVQSQLTLPATYMPTAQNYIPTQPMPVDFSLFKNPLQMFMQGANQGMEMGMKIADMPNAMEKLKAAKALTQKSEWAMQNPNDPAAQAYAMGPDGSSQFQGKNAQMMPDVALRRAQEAATVQGTQAATGLTGANTQQMQQSTRFMPIQAAAKGQQILGLDANGNPIAGLPNASGGTAPPTQAPGNTTGSANGTTNAQAAPQANAATNGNASNTVTIPKPTPPQEGMSLFTPTQVQTWFNTAFSNEKPKKVEWSPVYNQGQGGWVITHPDDSKTIYTDDQIQQWKGHWGPEVPIPDQMKMAKAARDGKQLQQQGAAVQSGSPAPGVPAGYDPSQDTGFSDENPLQTAVSPQAAQAVVQGAIPVTPSNATLRGGQPVPMPAPGSGQAPVNVPASALMPGSPAPAASTATPQNQVPLASAQNAPQGWKDPNPTDFGGTRKLLNMMGKTPFVQPDVGQPYLIMNVAQDGTETRQRLDGSPPETAAPYSMAMRQKLIADQIEINKSVVQKASDAGFSNADMGNPAAASAFLSQQNLLKNKLPEAEEKSLESIASALKTGEDLKKTLATTKPTEIGEAAQTANAWQDRAQGWPVVGGFVPKPSGKVADINGQVKMYKTYVTEAMNNSRATGAVGKAVQDSIGDPANNPSTLLARIDNSNSVLRPHFIERIRSAVAQGQGVPPHLIKLANDAEAYEQSLSQGQASGAAAPKAAGATTGGASPRVTTTQQYDALKIGDTYIDSSGKEFTKLKERPNKGK